MKECFAVLIAVGIGFPLGIMVLTYPSGPVKWVLKRRALKKLQNPQLMANLSNAPLYPGARCTWKEWLEALADDPSRAINKCEPWQFWASLIGGTIWLLLTARVAMEIKPVCGPVVQVLLQGLLH